MAKTAKSRVKACPPGASGRCVSPGSPGPRRRPAARAPNDRVPHQGGRPREPRAALALAPPRARRGSSGRPPGFPSRQGGIGEVQSHPDTACDSHQVPRQGWPWLGASVTAGAPGLSPPGLISRVRVRSTLTRGLGPGKGKTKKNGPIPVPGAQTAGRSPDTLAGTVPRAACCLALHCPLGAFGPGTPFSVPRISGGSRPQAAPYARCLSVDPR